MIRIISVFLLFVSNVYAYVCNTETKLLQMNDSIEKISYKHCTDQKIKPKEIGYIGDEFEFTTHPLREGKFILHKKLGGPICKWFIDIENTIELKNYFGVICHIGNNKWKVIQKF